MNRNSLAIRLVIAVAVGLAVFFLSCLAVWRQSPSTLMTNTMVDAWTGGAMRDCAMVIEERMERGAPPPKSLGELSPSLAGKTFPNSKVPILRNGVPIDGWGRPILYVTDGTSYTLISLGRDGRPGGTDFDRDVHWPGYETLDFSEHAWANPPMPTLYQFLFELPSGGMIRSCVLSGVIAFLATLYLVRPAQLSRRKALSLLLRIAITMLATFMFASIIMQLHIPSGH